MNAAKWSIGVFVVFLIFYFSGPAIFRAMKKKDFDTIYHGMQDAKRSAGAHVYTGPSKKWQSYSERYARERN